MTPGEMIQRYLQLRRLIQEKEANHKEIMAPLLQLRGQLEGALLTYLNDNQIDSTRSEHGTAFKQTASSVTVHDWQATLDYIKQHQLWELLEARVSKSAVLNMLDEKDETVPGVNISQISLLRVRQN